eukprot:TRINITY_DN7047_c0_g1_i1.p1 TRINITY_DN7047_c0_g1~~TRINITY_DN7047_c0_g1_i1.p1  ORF type:complete len:369 (+),score=86.70 TRINITY_DN7047_c0_g1_i1:911-2017(+)
MAVAETSRSLLNRRMQEDSPDDINCAQYWCVDSTLAKSFKKTDEDEHELLHKCDGYILDNDGEPCGKQKCFLNAYKFYKAKVLNGKLLVGGFLEPAGDVAGGIIGLIISLLLLTGGLIALTTLLKMLFMSKAKMALRYATKLNDYVAILIGACITILVQSSSVTTSALTPLCGVGALPLEKMLPLTLGANIGTTCTALLASLVSLKFNAVQIALCHLFFNIFGILLWFPIPRMRQVPLMGARLLGLYASYYIAFPPLYILVMYIGFPGFCLLISALYDVHLALGLIVTLIALTVFGVIEYFWWIGYPRGNALCYKVLTQEQREQGELALKAAQDALQGKAKGTSSSAEANAVGAGREEEHGEHEPSKV